LPRSFSYIKLISGGKVRMRAVVAFGISAVAFRDFLLYYWRACVYGAAVRGFGEPKPPVFG
jgi:hypothetical protein